MPYCFGFHPGFLWPQDPAIRRGYVCLFEKTEAGSIRRPNLASGLLKNQSFVSPLVDRILRLDDSLFTDGALIFDAMRSRRVWFGPLGANGIEVDFPDCPQLGIWTKPGAPFLCIEPWQGTSAIEGSEGELSSRPGARILAPEETHRYRLSIRLDVPARNAPRFDKGAKAKRTAEASGIVAPALLQIAAVSRTHLPFDSEPSHLVRGLARGKRA